jgi:hypothetical protein
MARALGERGYADLLLEAAKRGNRATALRCAWASGLLVALAGGLLLVLSGGPQHWAFWFAWGLIAYALVIAFYGDLFTRRLFVKARKALAQEAERRANEGESHA